MDDISKLVVSVSSNGISSTTSDLAALTTASVAAEGATTKLGTAAVTAAQLTKAHSDALKLKTAMQNQDVMVMNLAGKAYADAQKEAISLNNAIDTSAKAYANAQAAAIKMNASYDAAAASSKALAASSLEVAAASDVATKGHGSQATIIRESLVMSHEMLIGSYKRLVGSTVVMLNATGAMNDILNASKVAITEVATVIEAVATEVGVSVGVLLAPVAIIAAAIAAVGVAIFEGGRDNKAYADSLLLSGNYAGTTTEALKGMASAAVAGGGSMATANATVQKLAASGKFTASEIANISKAAIGMERAFGTPVDEVIADFEKLSTMAITTTKASHDAIVKHVEEMDAKYHILTISQFAAIQAASSVGEMEKSVMEADKAMTEGLLARSKQSEASLGTLVRAWHSVEDSISGAWNAMKQWGAAPDPSSTAPLLALQAQMAKLKSDDKYNTDYNSGNLKAYYATQEKGLQSAIDMENKRLLTLTNVAMAEGTDKQQMTAAMQSIRETISLGETENKQLKQKNDLKKENDTYKDNSAIISAQLSLTPDDTNLQKVSAEYNAAHQARLDFIAKEGITKQKGVDDSKQLRDLELAQIKLHYDEVRRVEDLALSDSIQAAKGEYGNSQDELAKREVIYSKEIADMQEKQAKLKAVIAAYVPTTNVATTNNHIKDLQAQAAGEAQIDSKVRERANDENTVANAEKTRHDQAMKNIQSYMAQGDLGVAAEVKAAQVSLDADTNKEDRVGVLKSVQEAAKAAELTGQAEIHEIELRRLQTLVLTGEVTGLMSANRIEEINAEITAQEKLISVKKADAAVLLATVPKTQALEAAQAATKQIDEALASGKRFATGMTAAFGSVGTAIGGMSTAILQFAKDQDTAQATFDKSAKTANDQATLQQANDAAAVTGFANMTQAAQGMFDKNSKGYKVMGEISQAFHLLEAVEDAAKIARTLTVSTFNVSTLAAEYAAKVGLTAAGEASTTSEVIAGEAAKNAAKTPGVFMAFMDYLGPWGMAAAGVAIAAVLGASASSAGNGSGNGSGVSAADAQKAQGTGTVLGDSTKQSDSIAASLTLMTTNSSAMLPLTQQMASSLKAMETGITGVATLISGNSTAIANGANMGIATGKSSTGLMGDIFGSTSTTIGNAGLQFGNTSVGNLQNGTGVNGQGVQQFAVQNTDSKGFLGFGGSNSSATLTQAVSDGVVQQFALVFQNLQTTLSTAATSLGTDGEAVGKAIQAVVLPTTQISLMGLTTAQQITAINAVLSSTMDVITSEVMPNLTAFAQMGEGPFQTVVRVASGIEQATVALNAFGISAINYTSIVNKQGDVGAEIVRQSIDLVETTQEGALTGVGKIISLATGAATDLATLYQSLLTIQTLMGDAAMNGENLNQDTISGAGGISQLNAALTTYSTKYFTTAQQLAAQTEDMTAQFAKLGDALPATRDDFVALVNAAEAAGNQTLVGQLLVLSNGFDTLQTSMGNASSVLSNIDVAFQALSASVASAQTDLTAQHTANLAAITASAGPQAAALQATYMSRQIEMMQYQGQLAASLTVANQAVTDINSSISTFTSILGTLDAAITSTSVVSQADARKQAMATLKAASTSGDISGVVGLPDAITNVQAQSDNLYGTLAEYQKSQAEANNYLVLIKANGTTQLTSAQSQLIALQAVVTAIQAQQTAIASDISGMSDADTAAVAASTKVQTDAENANYTAQQASLANILSTAQAQLDAINGVDTSVQSVAAAMAGFAGAVSSQTALKVVGGTATAAAVMAAAPDNTAGGYTQASLTSQLNAWYNAVPSFDVGTNVIPSDMLAKVHKGERIIPAADNVALMNKLNGPAANDAAVTKSNDILSAKLDNLIQVIQVGDTANVKSNNIVAGIVKRWENVGMPPVRSAV